MDGRVDGKFIIGSARETGPLRTTRVTSLEARWLVGAHRTNFQNFRTKTLERDRINSCANEFFNELAHSLCDFVTSDSHTGVHTFL